MTLLFATGKPQALKRLTPGSESWASMIISRQNFLSVAVHIVLQPNGRDASVQGILSPAAPIRLTSIDHKEEGRSS